MDNSRKARQKRIDEAKARKAAYNKKTQIAKLDERLGKGVGAKRERAKLSKA